MRRSQGRRSSNTIPIRPSVSGVSGRPSTSNQSNAATNARDNGGRSSFLPRPTTSSSVKPTPRAQDQSIAKTPSKTMNAPRNSLFTPQIGSMTPQSRTLTVSTGKGFMKETRNLSDKNCVKDLMMNIIGFLSAYDYPETITLKDFQKLDKQMFIKIFNFIYKTIDPNYQLSPRFNEDELIKLMKDLGYVGSLTRAALVSIGALHSTSHIVALLSWLADLVKILLAPYYEDRSKTVAQRELEIFTKSYEQWIRTDKSEDELQEAFVEEIQALYKEIHEVDYSDLKTLEDQTTAIIEERKKLEKKGSRIESLKNELQELEQREDDLKLKHVNLDQKVKECLSEEKDALNRLDELKRKASETEKEIADLEEAAKNSKMSVEEARRLRMEVNQLNRESDGINEQLAGLSELFAKRQLELANVNAEIDKLYRKLQLETIDSGATLDVAQDWLSTLREFIEKNALELTEMEKENLEKVVHMEQLKAKHQQINMETKHVELQLRRLDEEVQALNAKREERERIYLAELERLQNAESSVSTDSPLVRLQYEFDGLREKIADLKLQMTRQEKDIEIKMKKNEAEKLEYQQTLENIRNDVMKYVAQLCEGQRNFLKAVDEGTVTIENYMEFLVKPPNF